MKHLGTIEPDFFARREGENDEEIRVGAHLGEPDPESVISRRSLITRARLALS